MAGQASDTAITTPSLNTEINALLWDRHWSHNNLTFSFPTGGAEYAYGAQLPPAAAGQPAPTIALLAQQQTAVNEVLAEYAAIANLVFSAPATGVAANLRFARAMATDRDRDGTFDVDDPTTPTVNESEAVVTAYGIPPSNTAPSSYPTDEWGDMWFNYSSAGGTNDMTNPVRGNYGFHSILHEIGHVMGFDHPHGDAGIGNHFGNLASQWDSMEFTVMTYRSFVNDDPTNNYQNAGWGYAQSLMVLDIAALQYVYGPNFNTNNGPTTYKWNPTSGAMIVNGVAENAATSPGGNMVFRTVWDGGGNDTYDLSSYSTNMRIDLRPGDVSDPNIGWTVLDTSGGFLQRAALDATVVPAVFARGNIANARQFNNSTQSLIENAIAGSGFDQLIGNYVSNHLEGRFGNDTLKGGGGADWLEGGIGFDALYGEDGDDVLEGGLFADTLAGGADNDYASYGGSPSGVTISLLSNQATGGDAEGDTFDSIENLIGSEHNDWLTGNGIANILLGGFGADILGGLGGNDSLYGGAGDDLFYVEDAGDQTFEASGAGTGNDTVLTWTLTWTLAANIENLTLLAADAFHSDAIFGNGNAMANVITGNATENSLFGDAGNDTLNGGAGDDTLNGGADIDTADYSGASGGVVVNLLVTTEQNTGPGGIDTLVDIENVSGSSHADWLTGNGIANVLIGAGGNDTLGGLGGSDSLYGGTGDDAYFIDDTGDRANENAGEGADTVYSWVALFGLSANVENMVLLEADAFHSAGGFGVGSDEANSMTGNSADNQLLGQGGNDTLMGGGGNDTLNGNAGTDSLVGGANDDTYFVEAFSDVIVEQLNEGSDTVNSSDSYIFHNNVENVVLTGTGNFGVIGNTLANIITGNAGGNGITGGLGNDTIDGAGGNDTIDGQGGNDSMSGGTGVDVYFVDSSSDTIVEGVEAGAYDTIWPTATLTLPTNVEILILNGGALAINATGNDGPTDDAPNLVLGNNAVNTLTTFGGNDIILGLNGNDTINTGAGSASGVEIISGGVGNDTLTSGGGHDYFTYANISEAGDTITDFATAGGNNLDILDLRPMFFPTFTNTAGITTVAQAVASGHLTYTQSGTSTQVFADADGGAGAEVLLVTLLNTTAAAVQNNTLI